MCFPTSKQHLARFTAFSFRTTPHTIKNWLHESENLRFIVHVNVIYFYSFISVQNSVRNVYMNTCCELS